MKKAYFIGLAASCALLMAGCGNREKDQIVDPDAPAITDSTGLTEGAADVAGKDTDDSEGQSSGSNKGTLDTAGQVADVTGQTAVSPGKATDSSETVSAGQSEQTKTSADPGEDIGIDAAKKIALTKAGLTEQDGSWRKAKRDREDGIIVYELEFISGKTEYEFEIAAKDGKILEYQQDPIDD